MAHRPVGTPEFMKKLNRESVLFLVEQQGPVSQAEISRTLEMSRATVSTIVRELVIEGLLLEVGKADSLQGRRPTLLELNPRAGTAVAIDLSQPLPAGAVVDLAGQIVLRTTGADLRRMHGDSALRELLGFVQALRQEAAGTGPDGVRGIGIAVPGITCASSGVVRSSAGLGWYNLELARVVSEVAALPTRVDNDVNLAALGEMWKGAARGIKDLIMVHVGDGIGAAIVVNGRIHRGANDAAGEIGHMILDDRDVGRDYTEWGWLEVQASEHFLAKRVARSGPGATSAPSPGEGAASGSRRREDGERLMEAAAKRITMAVCNAVACLNPELCLLGGSLVTGGWVKKEDVSRWGRTTVPSMPRLDYGSLGQDAALIGAAAQVFQSQGLIEV